MAKRRKSTRKSKHQKDVAIISIVLFFVAILLIFFGFNKYQEKNKENQAELVREERNAFIKKTAPYSIELGKEYGILPSITIAQSILESDWGNSTLASKYNNYFGIKGTSDSDSVVLKTKEFENGQWIEVNGRFRVYSDYRESMKAHAILLANGTTWNANQYQHVTGAQDYISAAVGLQTDGYATDPTYTTKIIRLIQKYNLKKYDVDIK
ncbi:glycoside hydrolase family 73 protein [Lactobacillus terrae]|uniref:glycoside hydrolase family 73 protein n=1 Tax=Lactobacillus terrae TaxID=2269374 RepID=UPI000C1B78A8|nr:glycoside hydrolase family 73 protein [Lactobacillus terrae]